MALTTRQTKILARFWDWVEARGLMVETNPRYCGNREQPSTGVVLRADWNDFRGATVRPFHGLPSTYAQALERDATPGASRRYAVPRHREWEDILERIGVACEWSDEWDACEACEGIFRIEPDGYCWSPEGVHIESTRDYSSHYHSISGTLCLDCLQEEAHGCREWDLEEMAEQQTRKGEE